MVLRRGWVAQSWSRFIGPVYRRGDPALRFRFAFCTFFLHEPSPLIPSFFNRLELSITMGVFYYDGCVSILIDIISQIGFSLSSQQNRYKALYEVIEAFVLFIGQYIADLSEQFSLF